MDSLSSRTKIFAGVSELNPTDSYDLAKEISDLGVDYIFSTPPLYYKPSENALKKFYLKLSRYSEKPIIIYTIPERVGYNVPVNVIRQLALEASSITGIKATVEDTSYIANLILNVKNERKDFLVFSGGEHLLTYTLSLGGDGSVSAIGNIMPKLGTSLLTSWQKSDSNKIVELQKMAVHITNTIKQYGSFPQVIKGLLSVMGTPVKEYVREPLEPATDVYMLASFLCNNYRRYLLEDVSCE